MQTEHKYCMPNTFSSRQCWHNVNIMYCDAECHYHMVMTPAGDCSMKRNEETIWKKRQNMLYSWFLWNKSCTLYQIQVNVTIKNLRVIFVILAYSWEKKSTWLRAQYSCANHCRSISTFFILFVIGCYVWLFNFHFINEFSIFLAFLNIRNVSSVLYSDPIFNWCSSSVVEFVTKMLFIHIFADMMLRLLSCEVTSLSWCVWLLWHNSRKLLESECYLSG